MLIIKFIAKTYVAVLADRYLSLINDYEEQEAYDWAVNNTITLFVVNVLTITCYCFFIGNLVMVSSTFWIAKALIFPVLALLYFILRLAYRSRKLKLQSLFSSMISDKQTFRNQYKSRVRTLFNMTYISIAGLILMLYLSISR